MTLSQYMLIKTRWCNYFTNNNNFCNKTPTIDKYNMQIVYIKIDGNNYSF